MILSLIYAWPNIVLLQWGTPAFESGPAICSSTMRFGIGQYTHQRHMFAPYVCVMRRRLTTATSCSST